MFRRLLLQALEARAWGSFRGSRRTCTRSQCGEWWSEAARPREGGRGGECSPTRRRSGEREKPRTGSQASQGEGEGCELLVLGNVEVERVFPPTSSNSPAQWRVEEEWLHIGVSAGPFYRHD